MAHARCTTEGRPTQRDPERGELAEVQLVCSWRRFAVFCESLYPLVPVTSRRRAATLSSLTTAARLQFAYADAVDPTPRY